MAGHSKFKNIQHRKDAQDKKRAKIFTKLVREIITAAKSGGQDPQSNPRLRSAIISARTQNLPRERIEKAINQANSNIATENYTEMRYEGFAQFGVALIIEALTDNKNRTAAEVRAALTKHNGILAESGSVSFMFERLGVIYYAADNIDVETLLDSAIEARVKDIVTDAGGHYLYTEVDNFTSCLEYLIVKYGEAKEAYIGWKPHNLVIIEDEEKAVKLAKLVDTLEESDDVQRVFSNCNVLSR